MTLDQASYLYWNLYSVNIPAQSIRFELHIFDNPDTEDTDETNDEVVHWDVISALPSAGEDPPSTVIPFVLGTIHFEETVIGSDPITYTIVNNSDYENIEPRFRVCDGVGAYRIKYALGNTYSVSADIRIPPQLYKMYDGDVDDESNHIGYGYPMGVIKLSAGINAFDVNEVSYGNFAEDNDWEPAPFDPYNFFPYPDWWSEFGGWSGDWLVNVAIPDVVEDGDDITIDGIPFVRAQWQEREPVATPDAVPNFTQLWKVTPLPETGVFDFYTYP